MIEAFSLFGQISLQGGQAVQNGLNNVSDSAGNASGRLGGIAKAIGGLAGAMAGAALATGFLNVSGAILTTTADLEALNSQYSQVVGGMKGTTDEYIDGMAKRWGKHPNELKSTLMQYFAILKGKGLSEQEAYTTAQKYMDLTVDGNAFANEAMGDTTARFMGVIKGEYDSADTAMVNMGQTMLNDIAIRDYGKKFEELTTAQQENLKTTEAIRQQTSAGVTGQGAREAESYANKTSNLNEKWKEFQATLGSPLMGAVGGILEGMGTALEKLSTWFQSLSPETQKFILVVGVMSVVVTAVSLLIVGLGAAFFGLAGAIGISAGLLAGIFAGVIVGIVALVAAGYLIVKNWDLIKEKTGQAWDWIKEKLSIFFKWLLNHTAIGLFIKTIIANWDTIKKTTSILWDTMKALFQVGVNFIKEKLGPIVAFVKGIFDSVREKMEGPMQKAKEILLGIVEAIKGAFEKMKITIPKPKIPKVTVSVGHKTIKGVEIPYPKFDVAWNKRGGYFNGATLFGAGEAGTEALIPLQNKRYMAPFSNAIAENLLELMAPLLGAPGAGAGSYRVEIPLTVNGREIARAIAPNIDQELKRQKDYRKRGL